MFFFHNKTASAGAKQHASVMRAAMITNSTNTIPLLAR
jgi:hypothetical protein